MRYDMKQSIQNFLDEVKETCLNKLSPGNGENLMLVKSYLSQCKEEIRNIHNDGGAGLEVAALRTVVVDRLIVALFNLAGREFCLKYPKVEQQCIIVAIGGYGRCELSPASDIDIMFLYPRKIEPYVETIIERVLYVLWDTGLDVGYSTRNLNDCVKMSADLVAKTSLIDSRYLCGDGGLYRRYKKVLLEQILSRNVVSFIKDKIDERNEKKKKYGNSIYMLEPDIKEGEGGLRDLHTALWAAKVRFKIDDFKSLKIRGGISDSEYREIIKAFDFMVRIRNDLHFLLKRKSDQLTFALQEKIAGNMGYRNDEGSLAVENLMKDYYLTANSIKELSDIVVERCLIYNEKRRFSIFSGKRELGDGFKLFREQITISDGELFKKRPFLMMKLFELSNSCNAPIHIFARDALRNSVDLIDDEFRNSSEVGRLFINILKGDGNVAETLKLMHKLEVLGRYIPEFGEIKCQVQHDVYHIYTVDVHSLFAIEELRQLLRGEYRASYPLRTKIMEELESPEVLYLSTLLHDIGKGKGGSHEELGSETAGLVARRIGFSPTDVEDIKFLVLKHLRLSHTAQRRDLSDPKLIHDFAGEVGTLERLKMLYLLTYADVKAIGPDVWNDWKSSLFLDLYKKTAEVFEKGAFEIEDVKERIISLSNKINTLVKGEHLEKEVLPFLKTMPDRYLFSNNPPQIAEHMRAALRFKENLYIDITHNERRQISQLIVVTLDSPGLFSKISGVLAANNINILGAQVYSRKTGDVLDVFQVERAGGGINTDSSKWQKIKSDLLDVIQGVTKVETMVGEIRPSILDTKYTPEVKTRIFINNRISDSSTVIEVFTEDRVGLLYSITKTFTDLGLYIDVAKISTMGDQATDVFYVKDIFGQKVFYDKKIDEIKKRLFKALTA